MMGSAKGTLLHDWFTIDPGSNGQLKRGATENKVRATIANYVHPTRWYVTGELFLQQQLSVFSDYAIHLIHASVNDDSHPCRPHLWIRVLAWLLEAFAEGVNTNRDRLAFCHNWSNYALNVNPNQRKYNTDHILRHARARSERQVSKRCQVGSREGRKCACCGVCLSLCIVLRSVLEICFICVQCA